MMGCRSRAIWRGAARAMSSVFPSGPPRLPFLAAARAAVRLWMCLTTPSMSVLMPFSMLP
eukprot:9338264-Pyramimonas_sp.AAC.1